VSVPIRLSADILDGPLRSRAAKPPPSWEARSDSSGRPAIDGSMLPGMAAVEPPVPAPDSPAASPSRPGSDGDVRPHGFLRRRVASGTVVVALVLAPPFIFLAVHAAERHQWAALGGFVWIAMCVLGIRAVGLKLFGRARKERRPPGSPPGLI
jgi:hypothetical protein